MTRSWRSPAFRKRPSQSISRETRKAERVNRFGMVSRIKEDGSFGEPESLKYQRKKSIRSAVESFDGKLFCEWVYTRMEAEGLIRIEEEET